MEEIHHSIHIPQWKKDEVEDIKAKIKQYPVVGMIGIHGLPSKQFQQMRSNLRDSALIKVSKNTLIQKALEESSTDIKPLEKYIDQETGLIFSRENSFKLFKLLETSKTPSPIKAGMKAPKDIVVEKGPTAFPPGPIVGELQTAGIPAAIEGGKVVIRDRKVVAREGEVVSQKLATMLTRLEIYPLELGLDLRATYEGGLLFDASVLDIDETLFKQSVMTAAQQAFNLSVNIAYPTKLTIRTLITKAASESRNLAVNAVVFEPEIMATLLAKAQGQMLALAGKVSGDGLDDELKSVMSARSTASVATSEKKEETQKKDEEKVEPEKSENEIASGLGSLFG